MKKSNRIACLLLVGLLTVQCLCMPAYALEDDTFIEIDEQIQEISDEDEVLTDGDDNLSRDVDDISDFGNITSEPDSDIINSGYEDVTPIPDQDSEEPDCNSDEAEDTPQIEVESVDFTLDPTSLSLSDSDFSNNTCNKTVIVSFTSAIASADDLTVTPTNPSLVEIGSKTLSEDGMSANVSVTIRNRNLTVSTRTEITFSYGDKSKVVPVSITFIPKAYPAAPKLDGKSGSTSTGSMSSVTGETKLYEGEYYYLTSGTKNAQIFYSVSQSKWQQAFFDYDDESGSYTVKQDYQDSVFEYGYEGALVANDKLFTRAGSEISTNLYTVALKGGMDLASSLLNSSAVFKVKYIRSDDWGDVIEEDRSYYDPNSDNYSSPGITISSDDNIPEGVWIPTRMFNVDDTTYTGAKITIPDLRVYFGNKLLTPSKDYTVSYSNNINVENKNTEKPPTLKINLRGNYQGSKSFPFTIFPKKLDEAGNDNRFDLSPIYVTTGTLVNDPKPVITYDGRKLVVGKDIEILGYTLDGGKTRIDRISTEYFGEDENIRSYALVINGLNNEAGQYNGNYSGIKILTDAVIVINSDSVVTMDKVKIGKIGNQNILVEDPSSQLCPRPTITYMDKELPQTAFTYEWGPNNTSGTGRVSVVGNGVREGYGLTIGEKTYYFVGSKSATFRISGVPMSKVSIKSIPSSKYTYTGSAVKPDEFHSSVVCGNLISPTYTLKEGTDYKVTYKRNIDAGIATATLRGLGGFSGSRTISFQINPASVSDYTVAFADTSAKGVFPYASGGVKPKVTVTNNSDGSILSAKDYKVTYDNNKSVNTGAKVYVKGTRNITGSFSPLSFTIKAASISDCTMELHDMIVSAGNNKYKQKPVILNTYGQALKPGKDYEQITDSCYTYAADTIISRKNKNVREDNISVSAGTQVTKYDIIPAGTVINITVTGKENYIGNDSNNPAKLIGSYKIAQARIDTLKFKIASEEFSGSPIRPVKSSIEVNGITGAYRDTYEIVKYGTNTNVGVGSVTIRGIGDYIGTKTISFKITRAKSSN